MVREVSLTRPDLVHWTRDGSGFFIHQERSADVSQILAKYFLHGNFDSLRRQLNVYGFRKQKKPGPNRGSFHHPDFHRDRQGDLDETNQPRAPSIKPSKRERRKKKESESESASDTRGGMAHRVRHTPTPQRKDDPIPPSVVAATISAVPVHEQSTGEPEPKKKKYTRKKDETNTVACVKEAMPPPPLVLPEGSADVTSLNAIIADALHESTAAAKTKSRRRKKARRLNQNYATFHHLYTTPVFSEDYSTGVYTGAVPNCAVYGPPYLPVIPEDDTIGHGIWLDGVAQEEPLREGPTKVDSDVVPERKPRKTYTRRGTAATKDVAKQAKHKDKKTVKSKPPRQKSGQREPRVRPRPEFQKRVPRAEKLPVKKDSRNIARRPVMDVDMGEIDLTDISTLPRGVTMRPSGKWQAQLYFNGRSRYIGVFDNARCAAFAYRIVHQRLRHDKYHFLSSDVATEVFAKVRIEANDAVDNLLRGKTTEKEALDRLAESESLL